MGQGAKSKYILTLPGYDRLQAELEELQKRRVRAAEHIRAAKSYGDLSENFEYHEARREAGFLEGRILELREILPSAHVVAPEMVQTGEVSFGSVVSVCDLSLDEELDFWIVGPLEADPENDRISYESPLGAAFIGRKVGETVEVAAPAGVTRYEIRAIKPYKP